MSQAVRYYQIAAAYDDVTGSCDSQGSPKAQTWLGYMHLVGEGVALNRHKARGFLNAAKMNAETKEGKAALICLAELDEERDFSGEWLYSVVQDEPTRAQMFDAPGIMKPKCRAAWIEAQRKEEGISVTRHFDAKSTPIRAILTPVHSISTPPWQGGVSCPSLDSRTFTLEDMARMDDGEVSLYSNNRHRYQFPWRIWLGWRTGRGSPRALRGHDQPRDDVA